MTYIGLGMPVVKRHFPNGGGGASLNLDFTSSIPAGVTVNSSPSGYAPTSTGTLTSFSANAGRRTDLGLLVEASSTNSFKTSNTMSSWGQANTSTTTAAGTGPDGTNSANKVVASATTGTHNIGLTLLSVTSGTTYTFSVFLKAAELSAIAIAPGAGWPSVNTRFDASTGTATPIGTAPTAYSITPYGNGWYLCTLTQVANATGAGGTFNLYLSSGGSESFTGNGTSGVLLWNAQWEVASTASSPIITTSTAVTRTADSVSFTIPSGISNLTYTFDNNSTQLVSGVSAGAYTIPTTLNRPQIKTIVGS